LAQYKKYRERTYKSLKKKEQWQVNGKKAYMSLPYLLCNTPKVDPGFRCKEVRK